MLRKRLFTAKFGNHHTKIMGSDIENQRWVVTYVSSDSIFSEVMSESEMVMFVRRHGKECYEHIDGEWRALQSDERTA